jgi:phospholipase/lecithinase/hemolysin
MLAMSVMLGGAARAGQITGIVSFGDSLSDVGSGFIGSNGAVPPASAYYDGRFSNGPIWLDYFAFWDQYHPTTQAGQFIGALAAQSVPEPSSVALLALGLGALTVSLRWRRREVGSTPEG